MLGVCALTIPPLLMDEALKPLGFVPLSRERFRLDHIANFEEHRAGAGHVASPSAREKALHPSAVHPTSLRLLDPLKLPNMAGANESQGKKAFPTFVHNAPI